MKREIETATVGRMNWVEAATQGSAPPPAPVSETPAVIAIYHAALSHADAARLADLLKREGFPGRVVLTLVDAP